MLKSFSQNCTNCVDYQRKIRDLEYLVASLKEKLKYVESEK